MTFLAATGGQSYAYRKPSPLMWYHFIEKLNGNLKINKEESFYCGDAAGRSASPTTKKDFSADDKIFATNTGLPFHTPESFFLGESRNLPNSCNIAGNGQSNLLLTKVPVISGGQVSGLIKERPLEVVLMVGGPGSGKSTFVLSKMKNYVHVNNDL